MRKTLLKVLLVAFSASASISAGQYAEYGNTRPQQGYGPQHKHSKWQKRKISGNIMLKNILRRIRRQVDLSDTQENEIRIVVMNERKKMRTELKKLRKQQKKSYARLHKKRLLDFFKFMTEESFYPEAFKKTMEEKRRIMMKRREEIYKRDIEHAASIMKQIFKILTPQQRKTLLVCR